MPYVLCARERSTHAAVGRARVSFQLYYSKGVGLLPSAARASRGRSEPTFNTRSPLLFKAGGRHKDVAGAARWPRAGRASGRPQRLAASTVDFKCTNHL